MVDNIDYYILSRYRWRIREKNGGSYYAVISPRPTDNTPLYMHHWVLPSIPPGHVRDHINRDTLDNTRHNLRVVTKSQNALNHGNELAGIRMYKYGYAVRVKKDYQEYYIGTFKTLDEAKRARDNAR